MQSTASSKHARGKRILDHKQKEMK